ncbi:hypothetical protein BH10PSE12_BH10PSE12_16820 [soil metagenome]
MSEFLAAYGLWLLIALLVIIVLVFLFSGKKSDVIAPPLSPSAPAPAPIVAPETFIDATTADAFIPEFAAPEPVTPEPVTLVSGASTSIFSPVPGTAGDASTPTTSDDADNLLLLKGVGPKLATLLASLGVTRFAQIATWTDTDLSAIDTKLGTFKGRPTRDQWIDQAKYLASGDTAGFEAKYGKL